MEEQQLLEIISRHRTASMPGGSRYLGVVGFLTGALRADSSRLSGWWRDYVGVVIAKNAIQAWHWGLLTETFSKDEISTLLDGGGTEAQNMKAITVLVETFGRFLSLDAASRDRYSAEFQVLDAQ